MSDEMWTCCAVGIRNRTVGARDHVDLADSKRENRN